MTFLGVFGFLQMSKFHLLVDGCSDLFVDC
jgi:hypothetical protein